jgi:hypothetical protein
MLSKRPAKDISTAKNGVVHIFLSPSRLDTASSYLVVARACAWAPRRVRNRNSPLFFPFSFPQAAALLLTMERNYLLFFRHTPKMFRKFSDRL